MNIMITKWKINHNTLTVTTDDSRWVRIDAVFEMGNPPENPELFSRTVWNQGG